MGEDKYTAATCIIVGPDNEILMQLRDDGNGKKIPYPNKWNFLGGRVEANEDHVTAAVREIEEECGIVLAKNNLKLIFIYDYDNVVQDYVFAVRVQDKNIPRVSEGKDIRWLPLPEIKKLELGFHQEKILPFLEEYLLEYK